MIGICSSRASRSQRLSAASGLSFIKGVVDQLLATLDLLVHFALIVVPDLAPTRREYRAHAQQKALLLGLENPALRIDQRDSGAADRKAGPQIFRSQYAVGANALDVLHGGQSQSRIEDPFLCHRATSQVSSGSLLA